MMKRFTMILSFLKNKFFPPKKKPSKKQYKLEGMSWLSCHYNDPTQPQISFDSQDIWVIWNYQIKPAVLLRVPKPYNGKPYVGLCGFNSPCLQTFVPMWRIFFSPEEAQKKLDEIKELKLYCGSETEKEPPKHQIDWIWVIGMIFFAYMLLSTMDDRFLIF